MYSRIPDLREGADLTQREVAPYLHCSQQVYSNYELGQQDVPTAILIALADLHQTTVDYLLGRTDQRGRQHFGKERILLCQRKTP